MNDLLPGDASDLFFIHLAFDANRCQTGSPADESVMQFRLAHQFFDLDALPWCRE